VTPVEEDDMHARDLSASLMDRVAPTGGQPDGATWTVVLPSCTDLTVRPAEFSDGAAVAAMHRRCSPETLRLRYFAPSPNVAPQALHRLLVNDPTRWSVVAVDCAGDVVGHAQLYLSPDGGTARATLLVEDAHQGRGIGSALIGILTTVAQSRGARELHGWTQPHNWRLFGALVRAGLDAELTYDGELALLTAELPSARPA